MITNCQITAWLKRTGSDQRGEMQYTSQTLATPLQACCGALNSGQIRMMQYSRIEADLTATYEPVGGLPDIAEGDKIVIDSRTWLVTKIAETAGVPVPRRMMYLKEVV